MVTGVCNKQLVVLELRVAITYAINDKILDQRQKEICTASWDDVDTMRWISLLFPSTEDVQLHDAIIRRHFIDVVSDVVRNVRQNFLREKLGGAQGALYVPDRPYFSTASFDFKYLSDFQHFLPRFWPFL